MKVAAIPPGSRLADTIAAFTATNLRGLKDAGFDGVFGYGGGNLTAELLSNAHALGMGVCPVNYSREPGWSPSATLGEADATAAMRRLVSLSVPTEGLVDACDLEEAGAGDLDGYVQAWCHVMGEQGRLAGGYIGAGLSRTSAQIYAWPFVRYWRACSIVPEPGCGWSLMQLYPPNLTRGGLEVDIDVACQDWRGRSWTWVVAD